MIDFTKEEIEQIKKETTINVGKNIKKYRELKGLNQSELAAIIQSDRQYQYKIENGKVGISLAKLALIAKALNVTISNLVEVNND
ncbi:MAG: Helix-turn-helix domain [Bacteroidota bacterium]|jgi:transcriptional regulator with XRE-family HTH domain